MLKLYKLGPRFATFFSDGRRIGELSPRCGAEKTETLRWLEVRQLFEIQGIRDGLELGAVTRGKRLQKHWAET